MLNIAYFEKLEKWSYNKKQRNFLKETKKKRWLQCKIKPDHKSHACPHPSKPAKWKGVSQASLSTTISGYQVILAVQHGYTTLATSWFYVKVAYLCENKYYRGSVACFRVFSWFKNNGHSLPQTRQLDKKTEQKKELKLALNNSKFARMWMQGWQVNPIQPS